MWCWRVLKKSNGREQFYRRLYFNNSFALGENLHLEQSPELT